MKNFHRTPAGTQLGDEAVRIGIFVFVVDEVRAGFQTVEEFEIGIGGGQFLGPVQAQQDGIGSRLRRKGITGRPSTSISSNSKSKDSTCTSASCDGAAGTGI